MRATFATALLLVGCGPSVGVDDDDGGGDTTGSVDTGATATNATSPTTVDSTNATTATTVDPTNATTASTSGGTFGDDTTDDDGSSSGFTYIQDPDGGGSCSLLSQCDVWAQDCTDGEKCMPWACGDHAGWNATRCSELDDAPAQPGEPCTVVEGPFSGFDDCDVSSMCWNPDPDTLVGECIAFCGGSEANPLCADPSTVCYQGFDGALIACLPACDPLIADCAGGDHCMFAGGQNGGVFLCMPDFLIGAQTYGDDCEGLIGCGTGLLCRPAADVPGCATTHCCTTLGDWTQPVECPDATQECLPLFEQGQRPPSHEDVCYCGVEA
jgi:hypothetical protein